MISRRAEFLAAYQDAAYRKRYLDRVAGVRSAESRVAPGSTRLTEAVARNLFRQSEPLDTNETLGLGWLSPAEARELIRANAIRDGLSLAALSWGLVIGVLQ